MDTKNCRERFFSESWSRRVFLKNMAAGAAGVSLAGQLLPGKAHALVKPQEKSDVSFVTGTDRREMVKQALRPFEKTIREGIRGKQVIIKVNLAAEYIPLTATHPDAVRGLLDFLKPLYKKQIVIAESPAAKVPASRLFEHYNYTPLLKEYTVSFMDLNEQPKSPVFILGGNLEPVKMPLYDPLRDPKNYIISLTRPKTHDTVVITLGLKNVVMAAPQVGFKGLMHGRGPWWLHYNLFLVAREVRPDFTVIDGLEGLQGDGPTKGDPVDHGIALAGSDVIAVDRTVTELMGVDIADVGYLNFCADAGYGTIDKAKIHIIGTEDPARYVRKYRLNASIDWQMQWRKELPLVK